MKSSTINLDLTNVKAESTSIFSKVPAGQYTVVVAHSQFKDGKPGAAGLQVGYMIESGDHKGKMVSDYINIQNPNEKAVEIGLQRLRTICELQMRTSFKLAKDTDLINKAQFIIEVSIEDNEYQGKVTEMNRVNKLLVLEKTVKEEVAEIKKVQDSKEEAPKKDRLPWE